MFSETFSSANLGTEGRNRPNSYVLANCDLDRWVSLRLPEQPWTTPCHPIPPLPVRLLFLEQTQSMPSQNVVQERCNHCSIILFLEVSVATEFSREPVWCLTLEWPILFAISGQLHAILNSSFWYESGKCHPKLFHENSRLHCHGAKQRTSLAILNDKET